MGHIDLFNWNWDNKSCISKETKIATVKDWNTFLKAKILVVFKFYSKLSFSICIPAWTLTCSKTMQPLQLKQFLKRLLFRICNNWYSDLGLVVRLKILPFQQHKKWICKKDWKL